MPTGRVTTDLESGLPPDTGPWSGAGVGCADFSWSALRCTLAVAEEAARQLHSCVAWVSEESQKDYEAWNAAKKDDDLFGPLRPAPKQQHLRASESSAAAPSYAAPPAVHADFSRSQQGAFTPDAQQRLEAHTASAAVRRISLTDDSGDKITHPSPVWEDFRCSPTQPQYAKGTDQDQHNVTAPGVVTTPSHIIQKGPKADLPAAFPLKLPGKSIFVLAAGCYVGALRSKQPPTHGGRGAQHRQLTPITKQQVTCLSGLLAGLPDANAKARQSLLSPRHQPLPSPKGLPTNISIDDLKLGAVLGKGSFAVVHPSAVRLSVTGYNEQKGV